MISGYVGGDFYQMDAMRSEVRIKYRTPTGAEGRGDLLARSLHGRFARQPRAWWLTPARAAKWRRLFTGGFTARQIRVLKGYAWVYDGPDCRGLPLPDALDKVKTPGVLEVAS